MSETEVVTPARLLTRRPVLAFALGTVLAIAVAVLVSIATARPATFEIKGSVSYNCYPCGLSGHDEIDDGAQVTVANEKNEIIGVTTLKLVKLDDPQLAGLDLYNRTFTFRFTGIEKGEARYGFHAGDNTRATVWKTETEAAEEVNLVVK
ncbi:hypothetical protein ABZ342_26225 [Amycolatopsis sp. NPDC005961]|uniref:hypothetical protein n=1 Tax=Amycolatopsis sp. NPDC005961 TaxID=3156720 RepID=UPI0033E3F78D